MWKEKIKEKRFGEFYIPFCEKTIRQWNAITGSCRMIKIDEDVVALCCYETLKALPVRTLIHEMHKKCEEGELRGETDRQKYEYFKEKFLTDPKYLSYLTEKYPELLRLIELKCRQIIQNFNEMIVRLANDKEEIEKRLCNGEKFNGIRSLNMDGDCHSGGKAVIKITLDQGSQIVYKPHGLKKELLYQDLLEIVCKKIGLNTMKLPYLHRGEYGWETWLIYGTCRDFAQVKRYFKRMGIHLFLAHLLSATDLHGENIIAVGEFPVIMDMETFPGIRYFDDETNADKKIEELVRYSVMRTGILPGENWAGYCVNAIHPIGEQMLPLKIPVVEEDGTVNMRIGYRQVKVNLKNSLPTINGQEVDPYIYKDAVYDGFIRSYSTWEEGKREIQGYCLPFYKEYFRVVRRNTQEYSTFLSASLHPAYLTSQQKRRNFLERLREQGKKGGKIEQELENYEISSMTDMDIPIFYGKGDSCSIFTGDGKEYANYMRERPDQSFLGGMNFWGKTDCEFQKIMLQLSFDNLKSDIYAKPVEIPTKKDLLSQEVLLAQAEKIAEYILNTTVYDCQRVPAWMGIQRLPNGKWRFEPLGFDLYNGLPGILIFFEKLMKVCPKDHYEKLLLSAREKLFRYTENQIQHSQRTTTGAMLGSGSNVYAYLILYCISEKREYLDYAKAHAELLKKNYEKDEKYDFLSGNAGAIYVLGKLFETTKEKCFLNLAIDIGEWLWKKADQTIQGRGWRITENQLPLTGMSHGNSGFLMAYGEILKNTGNERYKEMIRKIVDYENFNFSEKLGNWLDLRGYNEMEKCPLKAQNTWCHGAPGILLSRLFLYRIPQFQKNNRIYEDIDRAVKSICTARLHPGMCICHGKCGNWIILNCFQNLYQEIAAAYPCIYEKKRQLEIEIMQVLQGDSWCHMEEKYHPGFMNGISGIGCALLDLAKQRK